MPDARLRQRLAAEVAPRRSRSPRPGLAAPRRQLRLRGALHDRLRRGRLVPGPARCGARHLHRHGRAREGDGLDGARAADRRRRHRLRRPAQRAPHRARLRGGRRLRDPARGPGISQEMRAHAGAARDPDGRHGEEDPRGGRVARERATSSSSRAPTRAPRSASTRRCAAREAYAKAGADVLFVESPESVEEMRAIGERFDGLPLVANMVEKGRTPVLSSAELEGARLPPRDLPGIGAARGGEGDGWGLRAPEGNRLVDRRAPVAARGLFAQLTRLMGFEDVWEFEKRHAE